MSIATNSFHDTRDAAGGRTFGRMAGVVMMAAGCWVGIVAGVVALI